jgi:hypothetical protein
MFARGSGPNLYSFLGAPNFIVIICFALLVQSLPLSSDLIKPVHIHALIELCETVVLHYSNHVINLQLKYSNSRDCKQEMPAYPVLYCCI